MTPAHTTEKNRSHRIVVTGMGHWFPENRIGNDFFDQLDIGSAAGWVEERVGIKERRSVLAKSDIMALRRGETTREELKKAGRITTMATMCVEPWAMARGRIGEGRTVPVDLVISGSSVPDWDIPANAAAIAAKLGIETTAFDVNSACSSFVVNLHVARSMMQAGTAKNVAIFNAERYSTRLDYRDRSTCVLFGDAASCAILEVSDSTAPDTHVSGLELLDTVVHSTPSGFEHVRIPDGGLFAQNGAAVQKFAVTKTVAVTMEILERNRISRGDLGIFIGHQANYRMLTSCVEKNGLTQAQHRFNVDVCGNQGAAGAPTVLSTHWDEYRAGQYIVVAVVGSGLTWGAALFRKL